MSVCTRCGAAPHGAEPACRGCGSPFPRPMSVSLAKPSPDPIRTVRLEKSPAAPPQPPAGLDAGAPVQTAPGPTPAAPPTPRTASKRAVLALAIAVVSGAATVAGFAGTVRSVGQVVVDAISGGAAPAAPAAAATADPGRSVADPTADAAPGVAATTVPAVPFAGVALRTLLLAPTDLPVGAGVSVDPAVAARTVSLQTYAGGYRQSMTPAVCERAKGLMLFSDGSATTSGGPIVRADGLRLDDGEEGSQQVRRFASEEEAAEFMRQQTAWFAECGSTVYRWPGRTISFQGSIFEQRGTELLLASAVDDDSSTGGHPEFDGWTRVGPVVFGAYLTGGSGTDRGDLEQAGRAVMTAARQHLASASTTG